MKKLLLPLLLAFFVCCVVALSFVFVSASITPAASKTQPTPRLENAGTHLLWESLAHQFLNSVPR